MNNLTGISIGIFILWIILLIIVGIYGGLAAVVSVVVVSIGLVLFFIANRPNQPAQSSTTIN
jgi:uncharacterized membrane protein